MASETAFPDVQKFLRLHFGFHFLSGELVVCFILDVTSYRGFREFRHSTAVIPVGEKMTMTMPKAPKRTMKKI